jgi:hypothetical protein
MPSSPMWPFTVPLRRERRSGSVSMGQKRERDGDCHDCVPDQCSPPWLHCGRSAASASSLANGAFGEHRRHETDGITRQDAGRWSAGPPRRPVGTQGMKT